MYGYKTIALPLSYLLAILAYVVKVLNPKDAPDVELIEYLQTSEKYVDSDIFKDSWGDMPFTKMCEDFSEVMRKGFDLVSITIQSWRKAYETLSKFFSFGETELQNKIIALVASGGNQTPCTMLRYYALTEGTRAAVEGAKYRKLFLGEFAHLGFQFKVDIHQFLTSLGASENCLNLVAVFYSDKEFPVDPEEYKLTADDDDLFELGGVEYWCKTENSNLKRKGCSGERRRYPCIDIEGKLGYFNKSKGYSLLAEPLD
jgi:hypothetical protein